METRERDGQQGWALILAVIIVVILLILGMGIGWWYTAEYRYSDFERKYFLASSVAESGLEDGTLRWQCNYRWRADGTDTYPLQRVKLEGNEYVIKTEEIRNRRTT